MGTVAAHEEALATRLWDGLRKVPGLRMLRLWAPAAAERVGVATFTLDEFAHPLLAAILSAEHAIGVRHGCFCAHPLIARLLDLDEPELTRLRHQLQAGRRPPLPGAVRASIGLGTLPGDIDRLTGALREIADCGPRQRYRHVPEHDEYEPVPHSHVPVGASGRDRPRSPDGSRRDARTQP